MTKIVFETADGIAIIHPTESVELALKDVPKNAPYIIVDDEALPQDRTYRNAWAADLKALSVSVDMGKARNIHRNRMREARKPKLAALDVDYQRSLESGSGSADIVAKKQKLRDITASPEIEEAQTPEALRAVWPAILT